MGLVQNLIDYFTAQETQQDDIDPLYRQKLDSLRLNALEKSNRCDKLRQQLMQIQQQINESAKPTGEQHTDLERYQRVMNLIKQANDSLSAATAAVDEWRVKEESNSIGSYKSRFETIIAEAQGRSIELENTVRHAIGHAGENAALLGITVKEFKNTVNKIHSDLGTEKSRILNQFVAIDDAATSEQLERKGQELLQVKALQEKLDQGLVSTEDAAFIDNALEAVQKKIANQRNHQFELAEKKGEKQSMFKVKDEYSQDTGVEKLTASAAYKPPADSPLIIAALNTDKKQALTIEAVSDQHTNNFDLREIVKAYVDQENNPELRYNKQSGGADLVEIGPKNNVQATLRVAKNRIVAEGKAAYGHLLGIAAANPNIAYSYKGTEARLKAMLAVFEQQIAAETHPEKQQALQAALNKLTFKPDGQEKPMSAAEFKPSSQAAAPSVPNQSQTLRNR